MELKRITFVIFMLLSSVASADLLNTGKITKFNVNGGGSFGIYVSATSGDCPSKWLYASKSNMDVDGWKALQSLALLAYAQDKTVSIFGAADGCTQSKFSSIDTLD